MLDIPAFFSAIEQGDAQAAEAALDACPALAFCQRQTHDGVWQTPLQAAASKGCLPVIERLIEAGVPVYDARNGGYPAVCEAHWSHHYDAVRLLMDASRRTEAMPPVYGIGIDIVLAARLGWVKEVNEHIQKDPIAVFRRGVIGETALHWAAHNNNVAVCSLLLDAGGPHNVEEICLYGGYPVHWAAEHAPAALSLLLDRGANPLARNTISEEHLGFTPLHMCASQKEEDLECVSILMTHGADDKAKDARGRTPLDVAKACGREKMAAHLASL